VPVAKLTRVAKALTDAIRASRRIVHPDEADLGFLYGTIVTDGAPPPAESFNLSVFAEGQIDRSATGSGVTARMALDAAKGLVRPGETRVFRGVSGQPFSGKILRGAGNSPGAVVVEVAGVAHYSGSGSFTLEPDDPFAHGFALPQTFGDLVPRA
jgi:trans-L-3-hydroxyproline dehydratase